MKFSSNWSIIKHHNVTNERDGYPWPRQDFDHVKTTTEAKDHEYEARRKEVPEDTRDLTGRFCGDPLPLDSRR